jgi:uncharacterized protein YllA (UPF0747 family)
MSWPLHYPPLVRAYLDAAPQLAGFYSQAPRTANWPALMQAAQLDATGRQRLVQVLRAQHTGAPAPVQQQIDSLLLPTTFTLTTGQQAGLAGGPLYTWYKAISTLKWAQQLNSQYPDYHVVPLFWVASEDHDADEVNHYWHGYHDRRSYGGHIQGPVGRHHTVAALLPDMPAVWKQYWQEQPTWGQAFRHLLQDLLGPYGMLVLDTDDRQLKEAFAPIMRAELLDGAAAQPLQQQTEALQALGYHPQLHIRPLNLFYQQPGLRSRLERQGDTFRLVETGQRLSRTDLERLLAETPEALSPNAALRPLYQQCILPNLAYIGGNAELAYWLQLRPMFDQFGIAYPLLLPRLQALAILPAQQEQLRLLGLGLQEVLLPLHQLRQLLLPAVYNTEALHDQLNQMALQYEALDKLVAGTGQDKTVASAQRRFVQWARRLQARVGQQQLQGYAPYHQARRLQDQIQPAGLTQERVLALPALGGNPHERIAQMMQALVPSAEKMQIWEPQAP